MAKNTIKKYRNQVMYSIYVRNHSNEGTFEAVRQDLQRIKSLGVDIIWLMPIHPIGAESHKGTLGCPYAISDYRAVNPEYGSLEDFQRLVEDIHRFDMKCIIDVVYNHTSPDSWLAQNHPDWFYHKGDGSPGNRIGEWPDVVDLDYSHSELWDYQIETLKYWASNPTSRASLLIVLKIVSNAPLGMYISGLAGILLHLFPQTPDVDIHRADVAVMMGHLIIADVEDEPALFSYRLVTELLREEMGFAGVVMSDSLQMKAMTKHYDSGEIAVKAVKAGVDVLLCPEDLEEAADALIAAVESDEITQERLEESVRRILTLKYKCGLL